MRCSYDADALFAPGQAVLTDAATEELARLAAAVTAEAGADVRAVRVEGYTDHRGSEADNLALSRSRAAAAAAVLAAAGIDQDAITVVGLGETAAHQPTDGDAPTDAEMAADRRVVIVVDAEIPITSPC